MITTAGMTHSQAVGVSPNTRWVRDGARSTATATRRSASAGEDPVRSLDRLVAGRPAARSA